MEIAESSDFLPVLLALREVKSRFSEKTLSTITIKQNRESVKEDFLSQIKIYFKQNYNNFN